jgi:hypothetical protein
VRLEVRDPPHEELFVLGQHDFHERVDDLVEFLLDEWGIGIQRLAVVTVQTRSVLLEMFAMRPGLDDCRHDSSVRC